MDVVFPDNAAGLKYILITEVDHKAPNVVAIMGGVREPASTDRLLSTHMVSQVQGRQNIVRCRALLASRSVWPHILCGTSLKLVDVIYDMRRLK